MTTDGTYTAVVDRFEDDLAVLLLEADGETVGECVLDRQRLPESGRHVDAVLTVELDDGDVTNITYEDATTESRAENAQRRFDEVSRRPPSRGDGSDAE